MGIDHIGPKLLKSCAISLLDPLTNLFQKCISSSCIPEEWKMHVITPIHKKGDTANISNYRPISLLCTISKVLERLIFDQVFEHILPNISNSQFGFVRNRSCPPHYTVHHIQQLLLSYPNGFNIFGLQ